MKARGTVSLEKITSNPRFARRKAKLAGEKRYIGERPCPKGHIGERHTSSGRCCQCNADWKAQNREKVLAASKAYMKRPNVRFARRAYERGRREARPDLRLTERMRARLYASLKGKTKSWRLLLPYSVSELKDHLERQFLPGMSWDNMGKWEVDHIVPIKSFDLSGETDEGFMACWALSNLRPMWKSENRKKSYHRNHLL